MGLKESLQAQSPDRWKIVAQKFIDALNDYDGFPDGIPEKMIDEYPGIEATRDFLRAGIVDGKASPVNVSVFVGCLMGIGMVVECAEMEAIETMVNGGDNPTQ